MRKLMAYIWIGLAMWCASSAIPVHAQELQLSLSREQILLGEQTQLQIRLLDLPAAQGSYLVKWMALPDSGSNGPIELISASRIDTLEEKGRRSFLQTLTLTSFDSGRHPLLLSPLELMVNGKARVLRAAPILLEVMPVNIEGMSSLHAVKSFIDIPPPHEPWYQRYFWGLLCVAALAMVALGYIWYKQKPAKPAVPLKPSDVSFEEKVELLKNASPQGQHEWRLWAYELDALVRAELSRRHGAAWAVADHKQWPRLFQQVLPQEAQAISGLEQYAQAMDPVQFGDRWPQFDQTIINALVLPMMHQLQPIVHPTKPLAH